MNRSRRLYQVTLAIIPILAIVCSLVASPALAPASGTSGGGRVFLDPGHGGRFPGAVRQGIEEADINLAFAQEIQAALRAKGHATMLSRTTDANVIGVDIPTWSQAADGTLRYATSGEFNVHDDLQARCDLANAWGADVFISIHANAATSSSANGAETFWRNTSTTDRLLSQQLASFIQQEYILETGLRNRGVKEGAFYVLRWSNMPAVLVETGFMSNSTELAKLVNPNFQRDGARAIARGIDRFLDTNPFDPVYARLAGRNRFETAASVAASGWPGQGESIILASGSDWPDSLVGSTLSRRTNAPMLLTNPASLTPVTRSTIAARRPSRILVLGGEGAISSDTASAAASATGRPTGSVTIQRFAGNDRFETAAQIAHFLGIPTTGRIKVVSGENFPDALSVGSFAGASGTPILMTKRGSIPTATVEFLETHNAAIRHIDIIGGTGVIDERVRAELSRYGTVRRIAGPNRFRTNLEVIRTYSGTGTLSPLVVNAEAYPDALSAAALGSLTGRPVILVGERFLPAHTREFLVNNRTRISNPTLVGGTGVLPNQMEWMLRKGLGH